MVVVWWWCGGGGGMVGVWRWSWLTGRPARRELWVGEGWAESELVSLSHSHSRRSPIFTLFCSFPLSPPSVLCYAPSLLSSPILTLFCSLAFFPCSVFSHCHPLLTSLILKHFCPFLFPPFCAFSFFLFAPFSAPSPSNSILSLFYSLQLCPLPFSHPSLTLSFSLSYSLIFALSHSCWPPSYPHLSLISPSPISLPSVLSPTHPHLSNILVHISIFTPISLIPVSPPSIFSLSHPYFFYPEFSTHLSFSGPRLSSLILALFYIL